MSVTGCPSTYSVPYFVGILTLYEEDYCRNVSVRVAGGWRGARQGATARDCDEKLPETSPH